MRRVNEPQSGRAAAAGGCVLLRREALERAGGFAAIRGEIIDDVNLTRRIKDLGEPIGLALSRTKVESIRDHRSPAAVWRMVRRTAFAELRYSWGLLAGTLVGLAVMLALPPLLVFGAATLAVVRGEGLLQISLAWCPALGIPGLLAWALMALVFRRTVRFFGLSGAWSWTLPLAGALYGAMTFDSALRRLIGNTRDW